MSQPFFIDHTMRATTFIDPRLPVEVPLINPDFLQTPVARGPGRGARTEPAVSDAVCICLLVSSLAAHCLGYELYREDNNSSYGSTLRVIKCCNGSYEKEHLFKFYTSPACTGWCVDARVGTSMHVLIVSWCTLPTLFIRYKQTRRVTVTVFGS